MFYIYECNQLRIKHKDCDSELYSPFWNVFKNIEISPTLNLNYDQTVQDTHSLGVSFNLQYLEIIYSKRQYCVISRFWQVKR